MVYSRKSSGSNPAQRIRLWVAMAGKMGFVASTTLYPAFLIFSTISLDSGEKPQTLWAFWNSLA